MDYTLKHSFFPAESHDNSNIQFRSSLHEDIVDIMSKALHSDKRILENWILEEASNMQHLQEAGSYRNALMERMKQIILPLFSNVLTFIDVNSNLEILYHGNESEREAWRALFRSEALCSHYITAPVSIETHNFVNMNCKFPFSWVVYDFFLQHVKRPVKGLECKING